MTRAVIKTTSGITANIKASDIRRNDDFIEIYCGNKLVGMFDHGAVQFVYLSNQNNKGDEPL